MSCLRIQKQLQNSVVQQQLNDFTTKLKTEVCSSLRNAFWHRKSHVVELPYKKRF